MLQKDCVGTAEGVLPSERKLRGRVWLSPTRCGRISPYAGIELHPRGASEASEVVKSASEEVKSVFMAVVSGVLEELIRRIVRRAAFESENRVTKMRIKGQQDDGG